MRLPSALRHPLFQLLLLVPLAGCWTPEFLSFPPQVRGNRVDADLLKQMVPGTTTRADAMSALGSPTTKGPFDDNEWIYIGELTKPQIGATQRIMEQQVVLLTFDQKGVLQGVETKNADDAKQVAVVSRSTPSPGSDASILQQLLGNVGKFSTGAPSTGSNNLSGTSGTSAGSTR